MTGIVYALFIAAAVAVVFLTVRKFAGNLNHSDDWWYGWAFIILVSGPSLVGVLQFLAA